MNVVSRGFRRPFTFALIALAFLVVAALLAIGWIGSERAIHPQEHGYSWSLADYARLKFERIKYKSSTNTVIAGRFFPGDLRKTIVLSHGYGDNQDQDLPFVAFLHDAGFNILTYDMRARGSSGGAAVTLGALEHKDLISAVDYLTTRPDVDRSHIGAWGISLGASTTILAAAEDQRIRTVVGDSGFSDAPRVIATSFETFIHLPAFPFAPITVAIAEWRAGVSIVGVRPVESISKIAPRPILLIHNRGDHVVTPDNSSRNFEAAREPKQILWIPNGKHADGHTIDREEYERRVTEFFRQTL